MKIRWTYGYFSCSQAMKAARSVYTSYCKIMGWSCGRGAGLPSLTCLAQTLS